MTIRRRATVATVAGVLAIIGSVGPVLAAPPANDDIASPIAAPGVPYTNSQSTVEATSGATDFDCAGDGNTVWYRLTASASVRLEANTFGSDYDTTLSVGTPDGAGGIDVIACNDDAQDLQSRVRWDAEAGTTYLFQVGSCCGTGGGALVFNIVTAPPFVPVDLTFTVRSSARVTHAGAAVLSGTYSCTGADTVFVDAFLRQRLGRFLINGGSSAEFECNGSGTWEMAIEPFTDSFGGGKARLQIEAFACNEESCGDVFIERTIKLRG
jgi:hypothetical protein